jgi:hypothetical protein
MSKLYKFFAFTSFFWIMSPFVCQAQIEGKWKIDVEKSKAAFQASEAYTKLTEDAKATSDFVLESFKYIVMEYKQGGEYAEFQVSDITQSTKTIKKGSWGIEDGGKKLVIKANNGENQIITIKSLSKEATIISLEDGMVLVLYPTQ